MVDGSRPPSNPMVLIARQRLPAARQLIADLRRSEFGFLDIPVEDSMDSAKWRKAVDFAKRQGLVPENLRLVKQHGHGILRISLVAGTHANTKKALAVPPVPLPSRLVAIHPSVAAIRDADDNLHIPPPLRRPTLLVLQAFATEFPRPGRPA